MTGTGKSRETRKISKDSLGRLLTFAPNLAACSNHLEHCCSLMFNGCAVSTSIESLRNWRSLLGDSIPMAHSTGFKLCIYFSKDAVCGAAKLCSKLQNNDFCATDANEMWYWCVLVNKEIWGFFSKKTCLLKLAMSHYWDCQASSSWEFLLAVKYTAGRHFGGPHSFPVTCVKMQ